MRKQLRPEDVRWLQRNLKANNRDHPQCDTVLELLSRFGRAVDARLDVLYNRKTRLALIDTLSDSQIVELGEVNEEIRSLQVWNS